MLISLDHAADERGSLVAGELGKHLPFKIRRFFFVFDVPNAEIRGSHAHKECHQFLVAVEGSVTVSFTTSESSEEVVLKQPNVGLYMPPMTWATQHRYTTGAILLVLASHAYDPDDYIRDYSEFLDQATR